MNCLDLILDALRRDPERSVTMSRAIFVRSRSTIAGRRDLTVEKQLDLWAESHGLVCKHDGHGRQFTFSLISTP
ncbi:MAG: hypothetical protein R3F13_13165 [Prosthecobacter sp.]